MLSASWISSGRHFPVSSGGVTGVQVSEPARCGPWNNSTVPRAVWALSAALDLHRRKYFLEGLMGITCPGQVLACFSYQKIREFLFFFESLNGSIHRKDVLYFSSIRLLVLFSIQECTFITCVLFFFFWFNVGFQKSRILEAAGSSCAREPKLHQQQLLQPSIWGTLQLPSLSFKTFTSAGLKKREVRNEG